MQVHMSTSKKKKYSTWRTWLTALMLGLLVFAVIKNWPQVAESLETVQQMSLSDLALMIVVFALTITAAAFSYMALALHPLRFKETALVELAASGVNRVLPAGTGSIGIHALFLTRRAHTGAEAAAVVTMNNLIGFAEHMVVLWLLLLFVDHDDAAGWGFHVPNVALWIGLVVVLVVAIGWIIPVVKNAVAHFFKSFLQSFLQYRHRPTHLLMALFAAVGVTVTNFAIFLIAAHAFNIDIGIAALFLAFTLGVVIGSTLPTPGGLGGVEAGIIAGLIARGVTPTSALAAAIAFRLVTYWLPLLVGTPAFFAARARKLV